MDARRVYRTELKLRLGYKNTWFRLQQKAGRTPPGHVDEGGRREWWTNAEADAIVEGLTKLAQPAPAPTSRVPAQFERKAVEKSEAA